MKFKKSGGKTYGVEMTAAEQRAFDAEVRRQLAEHTKRHTIEIEAVVIYTLRRLAGWGETRLKRFYDEFDGELNKLIRHYEMDDSDALWLCTRKLKEEGFDIEKWSEQRYPNTKWDVECK